MDADFERTMREVADKLSLPVQKEIEDSLCLIVEGARLCALPVPYRNEIEVWLDIPGHEPETFYPSDLYAALDCPPEGLMFNNENYLAALGRISRLFEQVARALMERRHEFIERLTKEYQHQLERGHEERLRSEANSAWSEGDRQRATELYEQLSSRTASEQKKIDLMKAGKLR